MAKIDFDKYYTDDALAQYCIDKAFEVIGRDNITSIIEPSAGAGAFSLKIPGCEAYDLHPEHESIKQSDFLTHDFGYEKGRLIIGNPPFGRSGNLARKFCKRSFIFADFVAFILPVGMYKNVQKVYEFDLIHSEVLPVLEYSCRRVACCFNIYRRPSVGLNGKPVVEDIPGVEVHKFNRRKNGSGDLPMPFNYYDMALCAWGKPAGKVFFNEGHYAKSIHVKVHDENLRAKIVEHLTSMGSAGWNTLYPNSSNKPGVCDTIERWMIIDVIKEILK